MSVLNLTPEQGRALANAARNAGGFDKLSEADVTRITQADEPTAAAPTRSKYGNVPTVVDGIRFDSKKEAQHWHELKSREKAGAIYNLSRQVHFELRCAGKLESVVGDYVADFVFFDAETGMRHVQDVKGGRATQTALYKWKRKHLDLQDGIAIEEL